MRTILMAAIVAIAIAAAATTGAAPEQTTITPGQMTQARVWVQNHGSSEAVPVEIRQVRLETGDALRVHVINGEASSAARAVRAQLVASVWDYRTITLKSDQPAERTLAQPGAEGWETTGIAWPTNDGTVLLLKRPR